MRNSLALIAAMKFHFKEFMNIILDYLILFLLSVSIALSTYTTAMIYEIHQKPGVVWLMPNDVSCGDIWTAEELRIMSEKYELRLIE